MAYDAKLAARIRAELSSRRDVVEKHMFGGIAFMVRGHMSVGVVDATLMLRLAPEEVAAGLERPHTRPMDFTGKPLKGFLYVDPPGIAKAADLRRWLARATAHAETRPVKAVKSAPKRKVAAKSRRGSTSTRNARTASAARSHR